MVQPLLSCLFFSPYPVCVLCSPGPPLPPQEVQVQCGQTPGVLQVRWKPPPLTSSGTSNGASVIGYAVCTKGQKVPNVRTSRFCESYNTALKKGSISLP